jgi:hypothetical protein
MTIGWVQPGTSRGMFLMRIGSLKTVPFRIFLMVPFGDFHMSFKLNSLTLASSGVLFRIRQQKVHCGAFDTNLVLLNGLGSLNCNFVFSFISILHSQIIVVDVDIEKWEDEFVLDEFPDNLNNGKLLMIL